MIEWHKHHIIPRYEGGSDDPSNLLKCNRAMHAFLHLQRYKELGDPRDLGAYALLKGNTRLRQSAAGKLGGQVLKGPRKYQTTDAQREAARNLLTGNTYWVGRKHTEESKTKTSVSISNLPKDHHCEHCDRWFNASKYAQWHGVKCKLNT